MRYRVNKYSKLLEIHYISTNKESIYDNDRVYEDNDNIYICLNKKKYSNFVFPECIKKIEDYTFEKNILFKKVTFLNGLQTIGKKAFLKSHIKEIELPSSLKTIMPRAFQQSIFLGKIVLKGKIKHIRQFCFYDCKRLESVELPDSILSVDAHAFDGCHALYSINIPESIASYGKYAFAECRSLKSIIIPNQMTSILEGTFKGCSSLTTVNIPESVICIEQSSFSNCTNLKTVIIPNSVIEIGKNAFYNCQSLDSVTLGKQIKKINANAFSNTNINCINLPESIEYVDLSFLSNTSVSSILITKNVKQIIPSTSTQLNKIVVDEKNCIYTSIDGVLFSKDLSTLIFYPPLKEDKMYQIPGSVKTISPNAFCSNCFLEEVNISNNVTDIGQEAFMACESLVKATLSHGLTNIEDKVFYGCKRLENITLPYNICSIGNSSFKGCESLENIILPQSIKEIEDDAFGDCINLKKIVLPDELESCNPFAFNKSGIQEFAISNNNTYFCSKDGVVYSKNGESLELYPPSRTTLNFGVPKGVKTIMYGALSLNNYIETLLFPDTVVKIEDWFTENIKSLYFLQLNPTNVELRSYLPYYLRENCKIYVPEESINLFKNAHQFCDFEHIYPIDSETRKKYHTRFDIHSLDKERIKTIIDGTAENVKLEEAVKALKITYGITILQTNQFVNYLGDLRVFDNEGLGYKNLILNLITSGYLRRFLEIEKWDEVKINNLVESFCNITFTNRNNVFYVLESIAAGLDWINDKIPQ